LTIMVPLPAFLAGLKKHLATDVFLLPTLTIVSIYALMLWNRTSIDKPQGFEPHVDGSARRRL
jgi:hypothetical protein